ncbi:helix-turn-helix transcriptional regulator [Kribbella shirazensis]|uniref:DNA-binding NarL/FixJ family response regulator n=1 Tax=Kribbella shirazensis TaxID=1105143 RepID=A0A7X5VAI4_9ACTN|nr:helix-turn-helix transcriptional regulator [Kribbella shirazensis]NIK56932.1 DNA-binding NarL/FixJ family response regulator [Kribbella shirazensis]
MGTGNGPGREAFDKQAWRRAYDELSAAAVAEPLEVDDLERLASAAYLAGLSDESRSAWISAHEKCAHVGDVARAARCAFWLAFALLNAGDLARGGGWVDRAQRLLDDRKIDCVERGYLRYAAALRAAFSGDARTGYEAFHAAAELGVLFRDPELAALARIGEGRCLIWLDRVDEGVALLDEGMVAIEANDVSPIAIGDAYCTAIEGCTELFDVRRAHTWTAALSRWVDGQPELMLYRGQCLIHRAEMLYLRGDWDAAAEQIEEAYRRLADPVGQRSRVAAAYLKGDLHRLRGQDRAAEAEFQLASELGRDPQPGLALLRLATGKVEAAAASIRRAYREAGDPLSRARLAGGYVEILLADGDVAAARSAADELGTVAGTLGRPLPTALHLQVLGAVLLAEDQPEPALSALRQALAGWRELDAAYEAARTRMLIAAACRAIGDDDSAELEVAGALAVFDRLNAVRDAAAARAAQHVAASPSSGLTSREEEVLAHIAKGLTNRQIAERLVVSEKTVATHVGHILTKLGLSSRAAATAYAYEHGLQ